MMGGMVTRTGGLTLAAVAGTLNSKTYYGDCCSSAGGTPGAGGCALEGPFSGTCPEGIEAEFERIGSIPFWPAIGR